MAYPGFEALTRREGAGATKGEPSWEVDPNGVLRRAGKVWVPDDVALREAILTRNHDDPVGGHYGIQRTVEVLQRKYFWKRLREDVRKYIRHCAACQTNKIRRHKPWGLLEPLPVATVPWKHFSMDFVTDLPISRDEKGNCYDSILVLIDRFTKYSRYLPVTKTITSQQLAELLMTSAFLKTGAPETLVTDRGSVFTSQFWSDICFYLRVKKHLSTAFHPQTDGQTERQNQEMESYLRIYMNREQDDWATLLPYAEYAYNSKKHSATGYTPIELAFGTPPTAFDGVPDEHWLRKPGPHLWDGLSGGGQSTDLRRQVIARMEDWFSNWETAASNLRRSQEQYQKWYNKGRLPAHFSPGDEVLLNRKNITTSIPSKKLDCRYLGPFRVERKIGKLAYQLELPPT